MIGRIRGRATGARTLRLVSTVAFAGVLTNGCDRVEAPAGRDLRGPIQLATAVTIDLPEARKPVAGLPAAGDAFRAPREVRAQVAVNLAALDGVSSAAEAILPSPTELVVAASTPPFAPASATPAALPVLEPEVTPEAKLVIPAPAPALTAAGSDRADLAYIPQISDSVRAAYIAQVDVAPAEQRLAMRSGDQVLGTVAFQVARGKVAVHIGQVLDLFEGQLDEARFASLRGSPAAETFVSLEQLQAAGIAITYNAAYDELVLDTDRG